mmetsp:Transcript_45224/g.75417  ORF Transcript_45224/g.75417 Transcript_45224/m.75417 type:complete len:193 (-) Transcript_45224:501-1079(-)
MKRLDFVRPLLDAQSKTTSAWTTSLLNPLSTVMFAITGVRNFVPRITKAYNPVVMRKIAMRWGDHVCPLSPLGIDALDALTLSVIVNVGMRPCFAWCLQTARETMEDIMSVGIVDQATVDEEPATGTFALQYLGLLRKSYALTRTMIRSVVTAEVRSLHSAADDGADARARLKALGAIASDDDSSERYLNSL